jgi:8-oxo-dGTP pyrophosphatase MutT (NUDIX family)
VNKDNPWSILRSTKVHEDSHLATIEHLVRDPAGQERTYTVAHFRHVGVRVLPVDHEGCTTLVGQHRFAAGYYSWELPAGNREKEEPPVVGAARELREETGLIAQHWHELPYLIPSGSISDERQLLFLAWGVAQGETSPDPQERLSIRRLPFAEALHLVLSGQIHDGGTVALVLWAHLGAVRGLLPEEVAQHLR